MMGAPLNDFHQNGLIDSIWNWDGHGLVGVDGVLK